MTVLSSPHNWYRLIKWLLYACCGIGCAYCVSSCSLNFGA
jgi:hypothetical protein